MLRKIAALVLLCAVGVIGVSIVKNALASPETKIRWRLEKMSKDFDLGRAGPCCRGLTDDFRDDTSGAEAQDVRAILSRMTLAERDPETKELLYRVSLPEDEMTIFVDPADPSEAHVDLVATFEKLTGGEWRLYWRVAIAAELLDGDDGWQIHRSTHETLEGQRFK